VEIIRNLVQNLIIIVILAMFLEMLLPAGELRKYVKMVMGLLIIVAVVQAVGDLVRWDYSADLPSLTQKEDRMQVSGIMEAGKKLSGAQQQKAVEQYRRGLANQVKALARINKELNVVDVDVKVQAEGDAPGFGQLKEITLTVARDAGNVEQGPKGTEVTVIEPVSVRVGGQSNPADRAEAAPPGGAEAGLVSTVANFYNLKAEQVKVVYR
jgi:stage III sporulation protein AF